MKTLLVWIFYFVCVGQLHAQQFGGNPPKTRWRQIDSDTARIIFPKGMDTVANYISNIVSTLAKSNKLHLGSQIKKVDIVLQNQTVNTNGYVGLGPYRSEFYTTPPPDHFDLGSLPWSLQLTLHEYRHVQQYNNFNNGLSNIMKRLFGQEGYALAINAAVPNWFFEGDAVYQETALTSQGRGRMPSFLKAFPALWESGKAYSWMKLRNGSYKDYVPSHYELGYLMVNYGITKYGNEFWKKVTQDASAYNHFLYPMQKAIKKQTGLKYKDFTNQAFDYYKKLYKLSTPLPDSLLTDKNVFPTHPNRITHYLYPFQISKDNLLYLKTSNAERPAFYLKNAGGERLLRYKDISIEDQYSYRNGKIVYAAYETDPRWRWKSFNVIKILDIATGTQKTLSRKTRYFSPDISSDGTLIAANNVSLYGSSSLVILNSSNGSKITEIRHDSISYFSNPKFANNTTVIAVIRYSNATTCLGQIDITTGSIEQLTPPSFTLIGQIDVKEDKVYFTASQHLKDELFYYDLKRRYLYKMSTPGVGDYFVNANYDKVSWSSFTAQGYQLKQIANGFADWRLTPLQTLISTPSGYIADSSLSTSFLPEITHQSRPSIPYNSLYQPINFHSWRPNYSNPEFSFTIYGNNILNTVQTQLHYVYNQNDKTNTIGGSILYGGLFPYINIGSEFTFNRYSTVAKKQKQWDEWNNYIGVSIPLSWASGQTYKSFNISSNYYYRMDFLKGEHKNSFKELKFSYLAHSITWGQRVPMALQDIYSRWGYSVNMQLRHAINTYKSQQTYMGATLYLPGFMRTQHLIITGGLQHSHTQERIFANRLAYARGFSPFDSAGVYTTTANYHFPLFYPDWGFANILYIQRIRANVFYDYTQSYRKKSAPSTTLQSTGMEIYFDTKWWNQHPLTLGFRIGKPVSAPSNNPQKLFFEFILPTTLIPK